MGPKRCLVARTVRRAWCRSPSTPSTVSTRCSSVRGPGQGPLLGDVAHEHEGHPVALGQCDDQVGAGPHLAQAARRCPARRGRRRPGSSPPRPAPAACRPARRGRRTGRWWPGASARRAAARDARPVAAPGGRTPRPTRAAPAPRCRPSSAGPGAAASTSPRRARPRAASPNPGRARPRGPGRARRGPWGRGPTGWGRPRRAAGPDRRRRPTPDGRAATERSSPVDPARRGDGLGDVLLDEAVPLAAGRAAPGPAGRGHLRTPYTGAPSEAVPHGEATDRV